MYLGLYTAVYTHLFYVHPAFLQVVDLELVRYFSPYPEQFFIVD